MTTNYVWAELHDRAVHAFGNTTPGQALEQQLIEHFERHPAAVEAAITKLADRYAAGKVHTPWPLVLTELQREDQRQTVTANIDRERDQAIRLAENYITNAGLYLPTEDEVTDDTFGPHGRLKQWADDEQLQERIVEHWRNQQPRAAAAIAAAHERARPWREAHAAATATTTTTAEPPADLASALHDTDLPT